MRPIADVERLAPLELDPGRQRFAGEDPILQEKPLVALERINVFSRRLCAAGRDAMSSSKGPNPDSRGSIRLRMPSSPASSIAERAR
jgi:hypothetical protein